MVLTYRQVNEVYAALTSIGSEKQSDKLLYRIGRLLTKIVVEYNKVERARIDRVRKHMIPAPDGAPEGTKPGFDSDAFQLDMDQLLDDNDTPDLTITPIPVSCFKGNPAKPNDLMLLGPLLEWDVEEKEFLDAQ